MTRTAETRDNTRFGKTLATLVLGLKLPAYGRDYPPAKP
jgi:hypothetical protein